MISLSTASAMAASASNYITSLGQSSSPGDFKLYSHLEPFTPTWAKAPPKLSTALPFAILALLLLRSIVARVQRWNRLRHIPGPFLAGWTSLWSTYHHWKQDVHLLHKELTKKYGPLVRTGPRDLICSDVDELLRIQTFKSPWRKDEWYLLGRMTPGIDSIFSTLDPELRRKKKRKITPGYAGKGVDSFEDSVDRGTAGFLKAIGRYADTGKAFDVGTQIHFATLDMLGEVAYGMPLGYLKNNKDMGNFLKINKAILPIMHIFSNYSRIFAILHHWPLNRFMPREGDGVGAGAVMSYARTFIDERFKPGAEEGRDIVQSFIRNGLTKEEILQEVAVQFFAGTDTTANTITMLLYFLSSNPPAYIRLRKEIDGATAAGLLSKPMKDSEIRQMPYMQACIREALRLMPPLQSTHFYKAAPPGGDTVCGYHVPHGARVATNSTMYTIGRLESFWGDDAEEFRPERWFETDEGRRQAMLTRTDLVFGHGQFACVGKVIAWMEISKTVAELLREFDVTVANPFEPMKVASVMTWIIHDFVVKIERRRDLATATVVESH